MKEAERKSDDSPEGVSSRRRWPLAAGAIIVGGFYLLTIFADFLSPYDYRAQSRREPSAPPSPFRFRDARGHWYARPFVYAQRLVDPLDRRYEADLQRAYPIEFFAPGYRYRLFGLFATDRHLFGVRGMGDPGAPRLSLLGTDALGRDRLSRLIAASRFSMLVGPLGTLLAALLGVAIGCSAGYAGRWVDAALMRAADVMMALPALVVILAARAAFPLELPPARAGALLIGLFVALGWAEMARLARGLVLELREREFVVAAVSIGMPSWRVLWRHILPNALRPLIVQTLLMLPAFLLSETALSFLGVGLQEPEASWGSLLTAAADVTLLERGHASQSFLLLSPALAIMLFVLGVRLLNSGLERGDE
jgi:peptide/nickel transport system permease protein